MKNLLANYGWCQILIEDQKFFIVFDEGAAVVKMNKYEISESQAKIAMESEVLAEKVAFEIQKKKGQ